VRGVQQLFIRKWEEETVPEDWKERYLIKLPKKGYFSKYLNCRRITHLRDNLVISNRMRGM
jgi:hypothetical protein